MSRNYRILLLASAGLLCASTAAFSQFQNQQQFNQWHGNVTRQCDPLFDRACNIAAQRPETAGYQRQLRAIQAQLNGLRWTPPARTMSPARQNPQTFVPVTPVRSGRGSYGWSEPENPSPEATRPSLPPIGDAGEGEPVGGAGISEGGGNGDGRGGGSAKYDEFQAKIQDWLGRVGDLLQRTANGEKISDDELKKQMDDLLGLLHAGADIPSDLKLAHLDPGSGSGQAAGNGGNDGHIGIKGLPGLALNDTSGNGADTPYGIPGLPGIYVNGPGPGSGLPPPVASPNNPDATPSDSGGSGGTPKETEAPLAPAGTAFFGLGGGGKSDWQDANVVDLRDKTDLTPRIPGQPSYQEAVPPPITRDENGNLLFTEDLIDKPPSGQEAVGNLSDEELSAEKEVLKQRITALQRNESQLALSAKNDADSRAEFEKRLTEAGDRLVDDVQAFAEKFSVDKYKTVLPPEKVARFERFWQRLDEARYTDRLNQFAETQDFKEGVKLVLDIACSKSDAYQLSDMSVSALYNAADEWFSWERMKQFNQNSEAYLKASERNQTLMQDWVQRQKQVNEEIRRRGAEETSAGGTKPAEGTAIQSEAKPLAGAPDRGVEGAGLKSGGQQEVTPFAVELSGGTKTAAGTSVYPDDKRLADTLNQGSEDAIVKYWSAYRRFCNDGTLKPMVYDKVTAEEVLADGGFVIVARPLNNDVIDPADRILAASDPYIKHWQIVFSEDPADNMGWFDNNTIGNDPKPEYTQILMKGTDSALMRQAAQQVKVDWEQKLKNDPSSYKYDLGGRNCQDFISAVIMRYDKLRGETQQPAGAP